MVNCQILSVLESDPVDAYLLSESSMFVFPHKIVLKTCGTTTLLLGLQRLLHIAAADAGFPFHNAKSASEVHAAATPYRFFYSRKNFLFPDQQRGPHRSWKQEVKFLDDMIDGGSAYMVGKMNGDHWYLYLTSPSYALTPPRTPDEVEIEPEPAVAGDRRGSKIPAGTTTYIPSVADETNDETLEILMTDLDQDAAQQFYQANAAEQAAARRDAAAVGADDASFDVFSNGEPEGEAPATTEGHALGTVVSEASGLAGIYPKAAYPDARIDAYMFGPCGFSANGLVPAPRAAVDSPPDSGGEEEQAPGASAHYFTVHVTPEPHCSFASFETNVPGGPGGRSTAEVIERVVDIFKPGRFSVTLFEGGQGRLQREGGRGKGVTRRIEPVGGYRRVERIVHEFEDYDLVFRYYEREGWNGGSGTRVGEVE